MRGSSAVTATMTALRPIVVDDVPSATKPYLRLPGRGRVRGRAGLGYRRIGAMAKRMRRNGGSADSTRSAGQCLVELGDDVFDGSAADRQADDLRPGPPGRPPPLVHPPG